MALIHTLGADVLKANVEARQAAIDLTQNVNKLGVRKGADTVAVGTKKRAAKKAVAASE